MAIIDLGAINTLVDRRFREIRDETIATQKDQISMWFSRAGSDAFEERIGSIGEMPTWDAWTGTMPYTRWFEQFNAIATHRTFAQGIRFEREALEDDLTGILSGEQMQKLVKSGIITQQQHAARLWNLATGTDLTFYVRSEGVPLASNSHTTRTPGVSTATGFDNLTTAALSPVSYRASRIQMQRFANDQGQISYIQGDALVVPIDQEPRGMEILQSTHSPDSANRAINPEMGTAELQVVIYWTDTNDWALVNKAMMMENNIWYDRRPQEFKRTTDFDTEQLKVAGTGRWSYLSKDWRWLMFGSVS